MLQNVKIDPECHGKPNGVQVKSQTTNEIEDFAIQELTKEYFDEAVKVIVDNHARGAVFHKAAVESIRD